MPTIKNARGEYVWVDPPTPPTAPEERFMPQKITGSIQDILDTQLLALQRVTQQLVKRSSTEAMTKDEIQSLATCIKVTMELKAKENELLDSLTDEELAALANSNE